MTDHSFRFSDYYLCRLIGAGSYSKVYLAHSMRHPTHAPVALKILQVHDSTPAEHEKFRKKARLLEQLEHPHLLRVLETGIHKNNPYIVSEYAPSGSLRTCLQQEKHLPLTTILGYLHQLALALMYLHNQGVIHQDIKPENIFFDTDGKLLLADFGIATQSAPFYISSFPASTKKDKRTQLGYTNTPPGTTIDRDQHMLTNQLIQSAPLENCPAETGTQAYMAPERFEGYASAKSDQYSLAVIVYELLTGHVPTKHSIPFQGNKHLHEGEHSHAHPDIYPVLPPALEAAILKALSKDPNDRYEDIMAFIDALETAGMGKRSLPQYTQAKEQKHLIPFISESKVNTPHSFQAKSVSEKTESVAQEKETSFLLAHCVTEPYIEKAFASLPWIERNCLLLSADAEFTQADIADILNLDEQAIQTHLRRATHQWLQTYQTLLKKDLGISIPTPGASYREEITQVKRLIQNREHAPIM